MRFNARVIFTMLLMAAAMLAMVLSWNMGRLARLVPLQVSVVTVLLVGIQLLSDLFPGRMRNEPHPRDQSQIPPQSADVNHNKSLESSRGGSWLRELAAILWIVLLVILVFLLGFQLAVPVYIFLFFIMRAGKGVMVSAAVALASGLAVSLGFGWVLQINLPGPIWL